MKVIFLCLAVGLLISCDSGTVKPEDTDQAFPFPENLEGEWINHQNTWGFSLDGSGQIDFFVLNTKTGLLENYLDEVDSIRFIDSSRFFLKINNCRGIFFNPQDTGNYSLSGDILDIEFGYDFEFNDLYDLQFTRYQIQNFEIDTSYLTADVSFNNESYLFESNVYERNLVGYEYYENLGRLVIRTESNNYDCIFPRSDTEIILGIENYSGPGTYSLWEFDPENRIYGMSEFTKRSYDVGDGFLLSGSIEIIEHTNSRLTGDFSANCFLDQGCSGSVSNGYFEIYDK